MHEKQNGLGGLAVGCRGAASAASPADDAPLPDGVRAVWDLKQALPRGDAHAASGFASTACGGGSRPRRRMACRPAAGAISKCRAAGRESSDYMQHDCQTVYAHPSWKDANWATLAAAWYQREISVPKEWAGRRITLCLEYLNSSATVFIDGKKAGEAQFPAGEVDLTAALPTGQQARSQPAGRRPAAREVMLMFSDTNAARGGAGKVERRGLCGDVYLVGTPAGPGSATSRWTLRSARAQITLSAALEGLPPDKRYTLRAVITDHGQKVGEFTSKTFKAGDLQDGRFALTEKWKPEKLWDLHTPQNVYEAAVSLVEGDGKVLDAALPVRFGFREFWIDGRDFYLNGTRIFLSAAAAGQRPGQRRGGQLRGGQGEPAAAEADRHQFRLHA